MYWLVGGEFFNNLARGLFTLALGMMLYQITDGLMAFAFAFASEFVLSLLLQGISGSITDRYSPKKVLVTTGAVLSSVFLLCVIVQLLMPTNDLVILFTLAIGINLCRPFFRAATFSIVPEVVEKSQFEKVNGYTSMALQIGQIGGMVLAGVLLELSEIQGIIFTVFGCFFAMWLCHCNLRPHSALMERSEKSGATPGCWRTTWQFLRENPAFWGVFYIGSLDFAFIGLFNLVLAPVVEHNFNGAERWLTILDVVFALGAIIGAVYIAKRKSALGLRLDYTLLSIAAAAATFLTFWLNTHYIFALLSIGLFGFGITMSTVVWSTTLQHLSPANIKGRLASIRLVSNSLMISIVTLGASWLNQFGYQHLLVFSVLSAVLAIGLAAFVFFYQRTQVNHKLLKGNSYAS